MSKRLAGIIDRLQINTKPLLLLFCLKKKQNAPRPSERSFLHSAYWLTTTRGVVGVVMDGCPEGLDDAFL